MDIILILKNSSLIKNLWFLMISFDAAMMQNNSETLGTFLEQLKSDILQSDPDLGEVGNEIKLKNKIIANFWEILKSNGDNAITSISQFNSVGI